MFRAPGGTAIGENIRSALFKSGTEPSNDALICGMMASHAQLVNESLIPLLREGNLIILDRFVDSTYTYQGLTEKDRFLIDSMISHIVPEGLVDKTLIVDVPLDVAMQRIRTRGIENFLDTRPEEFYAGIQDRLKLRIDHHKSLGHNVQTFNNNVGWDTMLLQVSVLAKEIMKEFTTR